MSGNHPTELLPALALGCLEADEEAAVRHHLASCDICRTELSEFQTVTERMAYAVPSQYPPERVKRRLMARISPQRPVFAWFESLMAAWPRLIPLGAVTALLLAFALGVSNIWLWRDLQNLKTGGLEQTQLVWLQPTDEARGAFGTLIVGPHETRGLLFVNALMPLASDSQYQLWLIKDGRRTSGGVFSVAADGRARVMVAVDRPLAAFDALGITIEPYGGSPGPTGKKVLGGKTRY